MSVAFPVYRVIRRKKETAPGEREGTADVELVGQVAGHIPAILASVVAPSIAVLAAIALWRKAEAERQKATIELELKKLELESKRPRRGGRKRGR
jgi:hypothetical protein